MNPAIGFRTAPLYIYLQVLTQGIMVMLLIMKFIIAEMRRAKAAKSRGRKGERAGQDLDLARLVGAALLGNMKKNSK